MTDNSDTSQIITSLAKKSAKVRSFVRPSFVKKQDQGVFNSLLEKIANFDGNLLDFKTQISEKINQQKKELGLSIKELDSSIDHQSEVLSENSYQLIEEKLKQKISEYKKSLSSAFNQAQTNHNNQIKAQQNPTKAVPLVENVENNKSINILMDRNISYSADSRKDNLNIDDWSQPQAKVNLNIKREEARYNKSDVYDNTLDYANNSKSYDKPSYYQHSIDKAVLANQKSLDSLLYSNQMLIKSISEVVFEVKNIKEAMVAGYTKHSTSIISKVDLINDRLRILDLKNESIKMVLKHTEAKINDMVASEASGSIKLRRIDQQIDFYHKEVKDTLKVTEANLAKVDVRFSGSIDSLLHKLSLLESKLINKGELYSLQTQVIHSDKVQDEQFKNLVAVINTKVEEFAKNLGNKVELKVEKQVNGLEHKVTEMFNHQTQLQANKRKVDKDFYQSIIPRVENKLTTLLKNESTELQNKFDESFAAKVEQMQKNLNNTEVKEIFAKIKDLQNGSKSNEAIKEVINKFNELITSQSVMSDKINEVSSKFINNKDNLKKNDDQNSLTLKNLASGIQSINHQNTTLIESQTVVSKKMRDDMDKIKQSIQDLLSKQKNSDLIQSDTKVSHESVVFSKKTVSASPLPKFNKPKDSKTIMAIAKLKEALDLDTPEFSHLVPEKNGHIKASGDRTIDEILGEDLNKSPSPVKARQPEFAGEATSTAYNSLKTVYDTNVKSGELGDSKNHINKNRVKENTLTLDYTKILK